MFPDRGTRPRDRSRSEQASRRSLLQQGVSAPSRHCEGPVASSVEVGQALLGPVEDVVGLDLAAHAFHALLLLCLWHGNRLFESCGDAVEVVRVDHQGGLELLGGTSKLGKDKHSVPDDATRYVFLGDQVQPVSQWCDRHHVRHRVVRDQVFRMAGSGTGSEPGCARAGLGRH